MKIAVVGTGYVGLTTGVCLAEIKHDVCCIDVNEEKIKSLKQGISPIYEPGIEELISKNLSEGRLHFTTSHEEAFSDAEVVIIAVGTPLGNDGSADLHYIEQAARDIARVLTNDAIVIIKSTVPVGINEYVKNIINTNCKNWIKIDIISNPEFLREGSAIADTMKPDRIVIGYENIKAALKIKEMYLPLKAPILLTSIRSAEMIKYAANAYLATKISFINEIANLCEILDADIEDVVKGIGMDRRIGSSFLKAGIGYGGSCFPKDVQALLKIANKNGYNFSMLKETETVNSNQYKVLINKALKRFNSLTGKKIALLGLAFKPETDDMREAPSIKIAKNLVELGATVSAYDPIANDNAKQILGDIVQIENSMNEAISMSDAVMIVTEWQEFRQMNVDEVCKQLIQPVIFDGRNCLDLSSIERCETIEYYPIGKPPIIKN